MKYEGFDLIAEVNDLRGINVFADRKFANRNDAFRLKADIKQNLVVLDLDDSACHQVALVKGSDRTVDELVHLLIGYIIQRKDGRVLNLTQRWTPFKQRGPDRYDRCLGALGLAQTLMGNLHALGGQQIRCA